MLLAHFATVPSATVELSPQAAPDLLCSGAALAKVLPEKARIVHFVRNVFDMVVSSFLYHSQDPTPEQWARKMAASPCCVDNATLALFSARAGISLPASRRYERCRTARSPAAELNSLGRRSSGSGVRADALMTTCLLLPPGRPTRGCTLPTALRRRGYQPRAVPLQ